MIHINQVIAADVNISNLGYNPAPNIPVSSKIADLLSLNAFNVINFTFIIIGLVFFANLIITGWDFMMSSGDPKKVASASTRLINGIVGLVVAAAAFIIVRLITTALGLDSLV